MLFLNLDKRNRRFLDKLPPKQFGQIDGKIEALRAHPFPPDTKRIKGMDWYRVDIGEYRIIFNVRGEILDVPLIGKRNDNEIYKKLERLGG